MSTDGALLLDNTPFGGILKKVADLRDEPFFSIAEIRLHA